MTTGARLGDHAVPFYVDERPLCVWDGDVAGHNRRFIRALQPDYFHVLLELLGNSPEHLDDQLIAMAARTFYGHGLETSLALTFAAMQAPQCVFAWMEKYDVRDVVSLIGKLESGVGFKNRCRTPPVGWRGVTAFFLQRMPENLEASDGRIVARASLQEWFARTLEQMASEFAQPEARTEYNAVKHGLRGMPGVAMLSLQREKSPGVPDENHSPLVLKGPSTGLSLLQVIPEPGQAWNLRVRSRYRNWDMGQALRRLQMATMWMTCVKAGLRAMLGDDDPKPKWEWVADEDAYTEPWKSVHGAYSATFDGGDFAIPAAATKEWIAKVYGARTEATDGE